MSKQKYDEAFKREAFKRSAVQLVESGQSGAQVARDLGVPANQPYAWHQKYRGTTSKHGNASENQSEITRLRKELALTKMELCILKKSNHYLLSVGDSSHSMKYRFILKKHVPYSIGNQCRVLDVSRTGYYKWRKHEIPHRNRENFGLMKRTRALYWHYRGRYGSHRITPVL